MPFIPHTEHDTATMLEALGASSIDDLFDEIPERFRAAPLALPEGVSEMTMMMDFAARASRDDNVLCFAGAGAYDHHIPAAVWDLVSRGEFMTAYTPYQAEASQGTLQTIYEYQSMIAKLTGMEVANASVYDGGSGLAEAALMAVRASSRKQARTLLLAGGLNPRYRAACEAIVQHQGLTLRDLPLASDGTLSAEALRAALDDDCAALVLAQPNFFGALEAVHELTDVAQEAGLLVIAVVNPIALAVLTPPGQWGRAGADIVVGDGQPLGIPMASGGPYFGFLCARQKLVRQMPGRIVGRTLDADGKTGYALTLQAREQHIRRGKATSNICTNQGLLMTAGTIYMALLGPEGLRRVAGHCHGQLKALLSALTSLPGVMLTYPEAAHFHEAVVTLPVPAKAVVEALAAERILPGVALSDYAPERTHQLLVCATERRTDADIERFRAALARVLESLTAEVTP
jgi:glycine dehydrogenase subunit 1